MSSIHNVRSRHFKQDIRSAIADVELRGALARAQEQVNSKRSKAVDAIAGDWESMREKARSIKAWTLEHLDEQLELFESNATRNGIKVHWAKDPDSACSLVKDICSQADARSVIKSKSMVTEEIGLNAVLEASGMEVVESDLGEWIVQIAGETPSHIVAPAIHRSRKSVHALFEKTLQRSIPDDAESMTMVAREVLRKAFLRADVGITGVNYLIAETGSFLVLENEGNQRLTTSLPRVHIAIAGLEKVLPRLADLDLFLRMIGRSGTGQVVTTYQNLFSGPKQDPAEDGPEEMHMVLVDNGRSEMLASERRRQTLQCIRCGACLNICPVYRQIGGHAYGSVYPGPIGSIFTPPVAGLHQASQLPYASSLCGACRDVCPVKIDIPAVLLDLREEIAGDDAQKRDAETDLKVRRETPAFRHWARAMHSPTRYRIAGFFMRCAAGIASRTTVLDRFIPPLAAWRSERSVPRPEGDTFRNRWKARGRQAR
ncbi:MAG: LutB/LldF family L-lactate oxidation iron-sulfur protein [Phycisphaerales bacterium]|nr:LutB/LldF family L-lactate oxidation iron-sulfur protein [Phycisphaerales bacterium]